MITFETIAIASLFLKLAESPPVLTSLRPALMTSGARFGTYFIAAFVICDVSVLGFTGFAIAARMAVRNSSSVALFSVFPLGSFL